MPNGSPQRDHWSGRLGFVLAAAGSAIGLGNLWKFPYITYQNDGGRFVLIYLVCILIVGLPMMCAEILIGRRAQSSVSNAFGTLGHRRWNFVGWIGVLSGFVILGFYAVIAGWSLNSFYECMKFSLEDRYVKPDFGNFVTNGSHQVALTFSFLVLTALIVVGGVSRGIERSTKVLMPVLLMILVYLAFSVTQLEGFGRALRFLFAPDFSEPFKTHGALEALGHAFFTLSLGMGAMITYGSYMTKKEKILPVSITIVLLDTAIALVACVIMFSIIFSFPQVEADIQASTVGMLFITIPELFYNDMPGGPILAPLFFVLVAFAALSSTISLLEVIVSSFVDRLGWTRERSTLVSTGLVFGLGILSALSLGASEPLSKLKLLGESGLNTIVTADKEGVLSILDHISANWLLPIGGLLITIYAGWVLPKKISLEELFPGRETPPWQYKVWLFFVRFVAPAAIGAIIIAVCRGDDFS